MSDFKVIETQEQLDSIVNERIKGEREAQEKKYSGYISPDDYKVKTGDYEKKISELREELNGANTKIAGYDKEIADRDLKIKGYESHSLKTRIAHETGLSYEAVDFLKGDDEDSIRKSAESLKSLVGTAATAPLATTEKPDAADKDAALRQTLKNLKEK